MSNWENIKQQIIDDLNGRNLKAPHLRINAIDKIESYLKTIELNQDLFQVITNNKKLDVIKILTKIKTYKLNGAEMSIVNELYKFKK